MTITYPGGSDLGFRRSRQAVGMLKTVLWSGFTNIIFISVFVYFYGGQLPLHLPQREAAPPSAAAPAVQKSDHDQMSLSRLLRSDFGLGFSPTVETESRKQSLPVSEVMRSPDSGLLEAPPADGQTSDGAAAEDASYAAEVAPASEGSAAVAGKPIAPQLFRDRSGVLQIGNFSPVKFTGGANECVEFGQDGSGPATANDIAILAQSDEITISRICAANGSIVVSCRNDEVTISPRRSRPNDGCNRNG